MPNRRRRCSRSSRVLRLSVSFPLSCFLITESGYLGTTYLCLDGSFHCRFVPAARFAPSD
jgi:hypothetical protein